MDKRDEGSFIGLPFLGLKIKDKFVINLEQLVSIFQITSELVNTYLIHIFSRKVAVFRNTNKSVIV